MPYKSKSRSVRKSPLKRRYKSRSKKNLKRKYKPRSKKNLKRRYKSRSKKRTDLGNNEIIDDKVEYITYLIIVYTFIY